MQRWEYRVVSFRDRFTDSLNEYGQEGWELVNVVPDTRAPVPPSGGLPIPGKLGDAASAVASFGEEKPPASNGLLWVLRRPLNDD